MNPSRFLALRTAAALGALLLMAGCGGDRPPQPAAASTTPPVPVKVLEVRREERVLMEDVVGTVRARVRSSVEAKTSGRIEWLNVVPGQSVTSGAPLVRLDTREIAARLEQALAQREQAERDLKRFTSLVAQNAVSRQEYDATEARARAARAAVVEMETVLGESRLNAPFAGVITRKFAEVGDLAVPGKPLFEIEDPTSLRFEADVPEALIGRVMPGASMPVRVPSLGRDSTGTVSEIAPAADPASRTFLVKLDVPVDAGLRSGLFGRVSVPAGRSSGIYIPTSALVVRGQLELAFVADQGKAQMRLIRTGKHTTTDIEVLTGLNPGERLIIEGGAALLDGQPVEVRP